MNTYKEKILPVIKIDGPEELCNKLDYDPETGKLTWKKTGKKAGWDKDGYIRVGKLQIYAHRIAFYKMVGRWPEEIDHKNLVRSDNRWSNLREVTHTENCRNIKVKKHNKTRTLHVHKHKSGGYDVRVGSFFRKDVEDFEEACNLAKEKRKEFYGEFA